MPSFSKLFVQQEEPIILAHRGSQKIGKFPENTIPAFKEALELGAHGFELDVRVSKDGELVVVHDSNLRRLTGINLTIEKENYRDLTNIHFLEKPATIKIPTIKEVFEKFGEKAFYNIEIKRNPRVYGYLIDRLISLVNEFNLENIVWVSSFDFRFLRLWSRKNVNIPTAFLFEKWNIIIKFIAKHRNIDFLHPSSKLMTHFNQIKKINKPICVWTVDNRETLKGICKEEIFCIITDNVPLVREFLTSES